MATAATKERTAPGQAAPQEAPPANVPATTKSKHPLVAFKEYLGDRMGELQFALPPHISPDRFTRVILTALQRKNELLACTRQSLWNACLLAAQDGLMPDGREGAIVPYGENADGKRVKEIATWMPMIEGLRKKARNSGEISNWEAHVVRQKDLFEVILGDAPRIDHKPYIGQDDPGPVVAAYSVAWLKDGTISREVMTVRDLNKIKAKSKAKAGPWSDPTFEPEMYRKTVARRHYKQLPHSSDLDDMIRRDDEAFGLEDRSDEQIEHRQQRRIASTAAAFDQFAGDTIDHEPPPAGDDQKGEPTGDAGPAKEKPAQADAPKPQGTPAKPPVENKPGQKPAPQADAKEAGDDELSDPPADDQPGNAWPADQTPADATEYQAYARAWISAETAAEKIVEWWKSKPERDLRNACGVTKETYDVVQDEARKRLDALRQKEGTANNE